VTNSVWLSWHSLYIMQFLFMRCPKSTDLIFTSLPFGHNTFVNYSTIISKFVVVWFVTAIGLLEIYRCFEGKYRPLLQRRRRTLKWETVRYSESQLVPIYTMSIQQDSQCTCNVTLWRVRVTIAAVETQQHVLHFFSRYFINGKIFAKKNLLKRDFVCFDLTTNFVW
jgi:hypothetical protein